MFSGVGYSMLHKDLEAIIEGLPAKRSDGGRCRRLTDSHYVKRFMALIDQIEE